MKDKSEVKGVSDTPLYISIAVITFINFCAYLWVGA